jgi:peptide/nickel transport system permease protein
VACNRKNGYRLIAYIGRRISIAVLILFGSTFITYNLQAYAGDPLAQYRESQEKNKEFLIKRLTEELHLDVPPPARYFMWLKGVLGIFTGEADFGMTRTKIQVIEQVSEAIPTTVRLVAVSTVLAIVLGITFGVLSAIRQYSRLDYSLTFVSFLLFSLPIFWIAVLLKEFLAIRFNTFLVEPVIDFWWSLGTAGVLAFLLTGFVSGSRKRVLITWSTSFVIFTALLNAISATQWLKNPSIGIIPIGLLGIGIAFGMTYVFTGLSNRKALGAAFTAVGFSVGMYYPFNMLAEANTNYGVVTALAVLMLVGSYFIGYFFTKVDKGPVIRVAMLTATFTSLLTIIDRFMQTWKPYYDNPAVDGRPIQTQGPSNILLETNDFWISNLDLLTHILLPTTALTLLSFAGYLRYSRGSLLEVLGMDYIRTARAKGVPEREVILRHALRNAMIPLTTLIAFDIAGILGGAIITEAVFGWRGMGSLFNEAIQGQDLNLLMGTFSITAFLAVMATLAADLIYSSLDPRIRIRK